MKELKFEPIGKVKPTPKQLLEDRISSLKLMLIVMPVPVYLAGVLSGVLICNMFI